MINIKLLNEFVQNKIKINNKNLKHKIIKYTKYNKNNNEYINKYTNEYTNEYIDENNNEYINEYIDENNNENTFNIIYYKIQKILGNNFKYNWIFEKTKNKYNIYCFEFINKSKILNINKFEYIEEKISQLHINCFFEIEDLKISNVGRFLVIKIKTINDYIDEQEILKQEYLDKINLINLKIEMIKKQ